jgi:uncharacterized ubiquitin-like protein YukD
MKNEFIITIDDKYCVYKYVLNLPDHISIYDIIDIVCDRLNIETPEGKFMKKPTTKAGKAAKVAKVMGEYKRGTLKAGVNPKGPKKAPMAKSRAQALAIAMSQAGMKKKK